MATLCGHGLDPLFQAASAAGMRLVDTRNEQTAAYMAESFGRLTGRPGVCAVSSGIAHVNALTGVANAWYDGAPMLLLSGAGAIATAGMGHFQDMDQVALARPLCKYARTLDRPERVVEIVEDALREATTGTPGPVHLTLPMDIERAEVEAADVVAALAHASRPLVVAGSGLFYGRRGAEAVACCERLRIPLTTPIWDRGIVDNPSPVFLGVVGAATGGPEVLAEADCIVMAGSVADYRTGFLQTPAIARDARVAYFGGPWAGIDGIAPFEAWMTECARRRDEFRAGVERRAEEAAAAGPHALHLIRAIRGVLAQDPVLLIDGGNIGQWAHQLLCRERYPGDWLTCGRSGVVGWGIGGAMAARLAFPERPVILLSGDGSFTFNLADLEPASRQGLGFVALVADDQGWGITRTGHRRQFGEPISSSLGPVDFAKVAEGLGACGVRAEGEVAVARQLREALGRRGVTVIHAPVQESGLC
jgi:acetolactate synthase-1/2/3 large subunit